MSSWSIQLLTLLGVAVEALASFVSTRLLDRSRWQREEDLRWDERRLGAYSDFSSALLKFINIAWRISSGYGLPTNVQPLDPEMGMPALADAESELSVQWEKILLLGSPEAISAAGNWRNEAWHLEKFARKLRNDPAEFREATRARREARMRFYSAVRADLRVLSGNIPSDVNVTGYWQQKVD
jgi:hypothetical protein